MYKKLSDEEKKYFWRLSKKIIGNDLYPLQKNLNRLYDVVKAGNDFNLEEFNNYIEEMIKIKNSAKQFFSEEEVSDEYK